MVHSLLESLPRVRLIATFFSAVRSCLNKRDSACRFVVLAAVPLPVVKVPWADAPGYVLPAAGRPR